MPLPDDFLGTIQTMSALPRTSAHSRTRATAHRSVVWFLAQSLHSLSFQEQAQAVLDLLPRVKHTGLHRVFRALLERGDFSERQAFVEHEMHRFALLVRQP